MIFEINKHKKSILFALGFFGLGFLAGLPINGAKVISALTSKIIGPAFPKEWRQGQEGLINPLLGVNYPDTTIFPDLESLKSNLNSLVQNEINLGKAIRLGVYFRDQITGHSMTINEAEKFAPASLIKIPMMITYFKVAEDHPEILNKQIRYLGPDHNTQH